MSWRVVFFMADKARSQQRFELLQGRHLGLGRADTTREEWEGAVRSDVLASHVLSPGLLVYDSLALGVHPAEARAGMIRKLGGGSAGRESGLE